MFNKIKNVINALKINQEIIIKNSQLETDKKVLLNNNSNLERTIKDTEELIRLERIEHSEQVRLLNIKIEEMKADFSSKNKIKDAEISIKIAEAVSSKDEELIKVRSENAVLTKEVSILESAFDNMGFDVKDMKEMLNKLVDGIVSKNEIKIIGNK